MRVNSKKERDHAGEIIPDARGEAASQRFIGRQPLVAVMLCVQGYRGGVRRLRPEDTPVAAATRCKVKRQYKPRFLGQFTLGAIVHRFAR